MYSNFVLVFAHVKMIDDPKSNVKETRNATFIFHLIFKVNNIILLCQRWIFTEAINLQ